MKKILLCTTLCIGLNCIAQDFEWQWAKRGGGTKPSAMETGNGYAFDSEQIIDIAIDADNNYYFLAYITQQNTEFDGATVPVYNAETLDTGYTDVVILSTDCEGNLRWTQTVGGADRDFAHKLVLDHNGGLYIGANIMNISGTFPNSYLPPHFSPDDSQPILGDFNNGDAQEGYKTTALLKYHTSDGSLAWRVMPQGDVTQALRLSNIQQVILHPDGSIVTLIGFRAGTHMNGQVTVPASFTNQYQYYILKFDQDGNFTSALPLALEGYLVEHNTEFRYDANLDRYYLAGFKEYGGDPFYDFSVNGIPITEQAFILAFGGQGNELWRKEIVSVSMWRDNRIFDLEIDSDSNLYLCGRFFTDTTNPGISLGGYQFPQTADGHTAFTMKLDSAGIVQWIRVPSGYTTNFGIFTGVHDIHKILLDGNKVVVATQIGNEIWGGFTFNRPVNHRSDPAIMMLDKATGIPLAVHDVMGISGYDDAFTAVALYNDGNYVTGGYFRYNLFTAANDNIPTLNKVQNEGSNTDFFIAKLANSLCGNGLGTAGFDKQPLRLYPNPTSGILNIATDEVLGGYEITGVLGQLLQKGTFNAGQQQISVGSLSAGLYIVNLKTADNRIISQKIVKE
jgi:hypothetical protein